MKQHKGGIMVVNLIPGSVSIFWGEFLYHLFGIAVDGYPQKKKRNPSVGQKILPNRYKQNGPAIVIANCLVWISVVAVIALVVQVLS